MFEWVESTLLPNEWDAISGTERGFTRGVTGDTRYGDAAYVTKRIYDEINKTFNNRYYYWVKNKSTVPNIEGRFLSALDIGNLVRDPAGQGYRFVALVSPTELAIYNSNSVVKNSDFALGIQYYTI